MDERWSHGMDGWRVTLYDPIYRNGVLDLDAGSEGEVTGYKHSGCFIWVLFDGETEPRQMRWREVYPA